MNGAIAAGHPLTAEAGAGVLAAGGNAVDARIAASFASWVAESPLTGRAAAASCSSTRARRVEPAARLLRRRPGLGLEPPARWRRSTSTSPATRRRCSRSAPPRAPFPARSPGSRRRTAATPRSRGASSSRPRSSSPAEASMTRAQAYLHAILDLILRHTPERPPVRAATAARCAGRPVRAARPRRHARADRRARGGGAARRRAWPRARRTRCGQAAARHRARPRRYRVDPAAARAAPFRGTSSARTRRRPPAGS